MIKDFKKSQFWINAKRNSNILREMVVRNVKNQYRSSVLGIFWTILNPLLNMIVLSIIFLTYLIAVRILSIIQFIYLSVTYYLTLLELAPSKG